MTSRRDFLTLGTGALGAMALSPEMMLADDLARKHALGDWLATPLHKPFNEGRARLIESGKWPGEFALLAGRMIRVLESQRRLGDASVV